MQVSHSPEEVNSRDKDGKTPVHRASFKGNDQVLQLLLRKCPGMDLRVRDENGWCVVSFFPSFLSLLVVCALSEKEKRVAKIYS